MPTAPDQMITRTQIIETYDKDDQQKLQAYGRHEERYGGQGAKGVPRVQQYGFSSHAPKGSHAYTMTSEGNPDHAAIIGLEHPEYRPKDLAEGEWKYYDKFDKDNFLYAQENVWTMQHKTKLLYKVGDASIEITDDRIFLKINNATIEMKSDGTVHTNE